MAKSPAFQFYVQDFLMGTMHFTTEEVGAYILLLCRQWDKGYILVSEVEGVCRTSADSVQIVLKKFARRGTKLFNKRLEIVRKERLKYIEMQTGKGIQGAKKRWPRLPPGYSQPIAGSCPDDSSSTSTSIKEINKEKEEWNTKPGKSERHIKLLTEDTNQTAEFIYRIKQFLLTVPDIEGYWEAFKIQYFTGKKFYANRSDCLQHFRNWLKGEAKQGSKENNGSYVKPEMQI